MQNQDYHKETESHLKNQTTGVNDVSEAFALGKNGFQELENIFWFIGKGYEKSKEFHKLLARTGNYLALQHANYSEDREDNFRETISAFKNNSQTTISNRANLISESLSSLDYIEESMLDIKAIFEAIGSNTKKGSNDKRLADSGIYLAEDISNMIGCTREKVQEQCGLKGITLSS